MLPASLTARLWRLSPVGRIAWHAAQATRPTYVPRHRAE